MFVQVGWEKGLFYLFILTSVLPRRDFLFPSQSALSGGTGSEWFSFLFLVVCGGGGGEREVPLNGSGPNPVRFLSLSPSHQQMKQQPQFCGGPAIPLPFFFISSILFTQPQPLAFPHCLPQLYASQHVTTNVRSIGSFLGFSAW